MKDSFEKIYFDLIMESNMKLIEEGKITNSILAGIASLGITGGSLYGLNKASEHSVKNLLDKYPTTQSIPANQSTNTHSNEVDKLLGLPYFVDSTGAITLKGSKVTMIAKVVDIIHLSGIEADSLVYFKIVEYHNNEKLDYLIMSDIR